MKKNKTYVFLLLLFCALIPTLAYATGNTMRFAQISKDVLEDFTYLHSKPQDEAAISFGYSKGAFLMILDESNGWYHVSIGNQQGYLKVDKVTVADAFSSTATLPVILAKPESETGWVNLRQSPSLDAEGLKRLTMDEQAILLGRTDDWCHVMVGDTLGYIKAEFTAFSGSYIELKSGDLKVSLYEPASQQSASPTGSKNLGAQLVVTQTTQTASEMKKSYQMVNYTEIPNPGGSINVQYPKFTGDEVDALNQIVYNKVQKLVQGYKSYMIESNALTIDFQAAVTLHNNKMVSTVFWGVVNLGDRDGIGKPYTDLYALNVDLSAMREVSFSELYSVNTEFEEIFLTKSIFPSNPVTSYNASLFHEMRTLQTREYNALGPFNALESVQCFLKPDGIVISVGAVHATGSDHFEAQLRYEDIQQYYLPKQKYWEN